MLKIIYLALLTNLLFAINVSEKVTHNELLSQSQIYIDTTQSLTIDEIKNKTFTTTAEKCLGFGYSPDFHVWVRLELVNTTDKTIHKIIEYDNPLTSHVALYEASTQKLIGKCGYESTIHQSYL